MLALLSLLRLQGRFLLLAGLFAVLCLVALSCGGGGGYGPTAPAMPQTLTVQVMDNTFNPKQIKIQPGDTVQWVMASDAPLHTVSAADGSFDSGQTLSKRNATFSHTFSTAGVTVAYYCKVHQSCCQMQGSVQVGDSAPPPPHGY
jgi:plastocyanin